MMLTRWTKKQRAQDRQLRREGRLPKGLPSLAELHEAGISWIKDMVVGLPEFKEKMKDLPATNFALAEEHFDKGNFADAAMRYKMVLKWQPENVQAHYKLGRALHLSGHGVTAVTCYKKTIELQPNHAEAKYMLAIISGNGDGIEQCPLSVIGEQFRILAPMFEQWYLQEVDYKGHSMMAASLKKWFEDTYGAAESAEGRFDIIELGCGTGLTGRKLRFIARRMVGVDISAAMMAQLPKPKEDDGKPLYDEEIRREGVDYLKSCTRQSADIIVASAVWNYNGALGGLFKAAAPILRDDGVLAFSLEAMPSKEDKGFVMIPQVGRFKHSESYVRTQLASNGYELIKLEHFQLYKASAGMMVLARKANAVAG